MLFFSDDVTDVTDVTLEALLELPLLLLLVLVVLSAGPVYALFGVSGSSPPVF